MIAVAVVAAVFAVHIWMLRAARDDDGDIPQELDFALMLIMDACVATVVTTGALTASYILSAARSRCGRTDT
jgi:hypothetical protein